MGDRDKLNKPVNYVHQSIIREECIKKEGKYEGINNSKHYQLNPFNCKLDFY